MKGEDGRKGGEEEIKRKEGMARKEKKGEVGRKGGRGER